MKKTWSVVSVLLLIALAVNGQQLTGGWKEVYRTKTDNSPVTFTDTFFLKFNPQKDQYVYRWGNYRFGSLGKVVSYVREGNEVYDGDSYAYAGKDGSYLFTIVRYSPTSLVIRNNNFIREYVPFVDVGQDLAPESTSRPVPSLDIMKGHWSEFKRESKNYAPIDYKRLIKFMDIFESFQDDNYGYLFATRDADDNPSWHIDRYEPNSQILYCSGRDARQLHVLRCEDNELRLEEDGIVYYFRKFIQ